MALINMWKGSFDGKIGKIVGSKWKNKSTVRSFTPPTDPHTAAQTEVRDTFGSMTSFLSLFTDQLKAYSPLNTKGMSVRNAIISLNKAQIQVKTWDKTTLKIARGGLLPVSGVTATVPAGLASINIGWTASTAVNISPKALLVAVVVDANSGFAVVGTALQSAGTLSIPATVPASAVLDVYTYLLDYRGSTKVGSQSAYRTVTAPSA